MNSCNLSVTDGEKTHLGGLSEQNFVRLEKSYGVRILTRQPGITVQSLNQDSVQKVQAILERMRESIQFGQQLSDFYLDELIGTPGEGKVDKDFLASLEKPIWIDRFGHPVQPKTKNQLRLLKTIQEFDLVFAAGPAGTGKTFLAIAMAVQALEKKLVDRVVLCRPAVESGESLGFLPGVISEKIAPYMRPLYDSLSQMLTSEKLKEYWDGNVIEIAPLAYMRGRTLNRSFIILDEAQNATAAQMKMFLTRIGMASKTVLTGDESQVDLQAREKSGFAHARRILSNIEGIGQVELGVEDVVRHKLVREIIQAYEIDESQGIRRPPENK